MLRKELHIINLILLFSGVLFANNGLERANKLFEDKSYALAIPEYEKILENQVLPEAMLKLALSYWEIRNAEQAEQWFEIASLNGGFNRVNEYFSSEYLYTYAEVLKFNGKFKKAREQFFEYESISGNTKGGLQAKICTIIPVLMRDSSKVKVRSFDFNTKLSEFSPVLKNETLYYVGIEENASRSDLDMYTGDPYLDILMAKYPGTDSSLSPEPFSKRVNTILNEGPFTFSRSGDKIIFTRNYYDKGKEQRRGDGFLGFGLFESSKNENDKWSDPVKLNVGEITANYGHPCLTYNGEQLYFVSDMPGGYGGTDIYVCTRLSEGWSSPRNLGPTINTQGNEAYPYLHLTGTLYFSSDYHQGIGGLDIFSARKEDSGEWSNIRNLGYPINSSADDFGLFLKPDSRSGYFSSNRSGGKGGDDIYSAIIDVPMDQMMDIDSLISALDSSVVEHTNEIIPDNSILSMDSILSVEKEALKSTSGGYFELVYEDQKTDLSIEEELRIIEQIDVDNEDAVKKYFGEDKQLRTEEELKEEIEAYEKSKVETPLVEKGAAEESDGPEPIVINEPEVSKENKSSDKTLTVQDIMDDDSNLIINEKSLGIINKSVDGLVFRIQIGAYRVPVYGGTENFFGKKGVESYELNDNIIRYLLPNSFETLKEAEAYRKSLTGEKLKGAFVVPFLNATRIDLRKALQLLQE